MAPGDITDRSSVAPAVAGQEAVLSALGSRTLRPNTVLSTGIGYGPGRDARTPRPLAGGHERARGGRDPRPTGAVDNLLPIPLPLRHSFAEKERLEARLRASQTEWKIGRPGALTTGPARGR